MFRELLQNSDDAFSNAVQIRFETKEYIDGNNSSEGQAPPLLGGHLPDLQTAVVRSSRFLSRFVDLMVLLRCIDGRSRTTGSHSGMRIGID